MNQSKKFFLQAFSEPLSSNYKRCFVEGKPLALVVLASGGR